MRVFSFMPAMITAIVMLSMPVPGFAEFYQYTDESGNLHFTDNPAEIPEGQLEQLQVHSSLELESDPDFAVGSGQTVEIGAQKDVPANGTAGTTAFETWDGEVRKTAKALDRKKVELDKTFHQLQEEKKQLVEMDIKDMKPDELGAHKDRVHELNEKIRSYDEQRKTFQKEVNDFNSRLQR